MTQGGSATGRARAGTARPMTDGSSMAPERANRPRDSDHRRKHWTRGGGGRPLCERRARGDVEGKWLTRGGRGIQQGEGASPGRGAGGRGAGVQGRRQIQTRMEHIGAKEREVVERLTRGGVKEIMRAGLGRSEVGAVRGAGLGRGPPEPHRGKHGRPCTRE